MDTPLTRFEALRIAVLRAGTQDAFAELCGVAQGTVSRWLNITRQLPAEHVLTVEAATGVSRHDLRPDIYPRAEMPRQRMVDQGGAGRFIGVDRYQDQAA